MVIDRMPRARDESGFNRKSKPLVVSGNLKINGRLQKPHRITAGQTYFLVKLDAGRLRLSLSIPPGWGLDPEHKTARIKLYQVSKDDH